MSKVRREHNWVREPLTDIEEDPTWDSPFVVPVEGRENGFTTLPSLRTGLIEPPSYLVGLLLRSIVGFKWGTGDKSAWEVRVVFKGKRFRIWDNRRSSWSIGPMDAAGPSEQLTSRLVRKITQAAERLDEMLEPELKGQVDAGEFYLVNSHRHVRGIFQYFRDMVETTRSQLETSREAPMPSFDDDPNLEVTMLPTGGKMTRSPLLNNHMNIQLRLQEAVSHNSVAMLGFFFSYIELLLDALFAFQPNRSIHYLEFQQKTWDERFKMVLPVSTDMELKRLYEKDLRRLRKRIRDQMFHGLGGRPGLLVSISQLGLIPTSYGVLKDHVHYSWHPVTEEESREILNVCAAFDAWIDGNDAVWYIHRFIESGFEIPFDSDRVKKVRSWMTSRDEFDAEIDREAEHRDYLSEQY